MSTKVFATLSLMALSVVTPHVLVTPMFAERPLTAEIPFDFTVGSTFMRAGVYTVTFDNPGIVKIAREDRKASCAVLTMAVQAGKTPEVGKLVFNKYGKSHFLSQIWSAGYGQGKALRRSKAELEIARNAATSQVASVPAGDR
jgi:hypothetical protein